MRSVIRYRSSAIIFFVILLCVMLLTQCIDHGKNNSTTTVNSKYNDYAGSAKCMTCHKTIYDSHLLTAHFLTSAVAAENNIKGSFDTGKNNFVYNNGGLISMEKRADGYYQVAYINGEEKKKQRFDIVIGSGTKGQSFAAWVNENLVQLPITYFTSVHQWSNSPGYPNKMAFNRPITSRCLECHATFVQSLSEPDKIPEAFSRNQMLLGVDCEKCHGPAAKHVDYQTQNPGDKLAKFIINPSTFTRQQSLDLCSLCHGGKLQKTRPSFSFTSGNSLADYFLIDTTPKNTDNIDVHGNQYGLLAASKCFRMSKTLTCVTCHNAHANEKGQVATYSMRCLNCHNDKQSGTKICKMTHSMGEAISKDCISCHMPEQPSMAISVLLQGAQTATPALMHTHLIKNYPEETKKVLAYLKH